MLCKSVLVLVILSLMLVKGVKIYLSHGNTIEIIVQALTSKMYLHRSVSWKHSKLLPMLLLVY